MRLHLEVVRLAWFGGDSQKRLRCEKVDAGDGIPRLVCKVYEVDETGSATKVIAQMTIVQTEAGLEFEDIDAETSQIDEIKQLVAKTLKPKTTGL